MEHKDQIPLKWPDGWRRTLIDQRKSQGSWKRQMSFYREQVLKELERLGASAVTISFNEPHKERIDPGVAVWFSLEPSDDYSWQTALGIDSPLPTADEIRAAFIKAAGKHHPDQVAAGSGGDTKIYLELEEQRRKAMAWIRSGAEQAMDNCIPCDRFVSQQQNLAAIRQALDAFRKLERVGIPAILERVMDRAFKAALPAKGAEANGTAATSA